MRPSADTVMTDPDCGIHREPFVNDGTRPLPRQLRGSVLLLGNFDGLHLGHRTLVAEGLRQAMATGRPLAVLQCDPHPRAYFRNDRGFLISCASVQRRLLTEAGIDLIYAPRFDEAFAAQPAESFITRHLTSELGVSAVIVGRDFRFGHRRGGDVALLEQMGHAAGFSTHVIGECRDTAGDGMRISSSRIRTAVQTGDMAEAERLLGRPFEAMVAHRPDGWRFDPMQILPPDGIFMVQARGAADRRLGQLMLALKGGRPKASLPAGTQSLCWNSGPFSRTLTTSK